MSKPTWTDLTPAEREWAEERAAIREHDGGQPRAQAEAEAIRDVLRAREGHR